MTVVQEFRSFCILLYSSSSKSTTIPESNFVKLLCIYWFYRENYYQEGNHVYPRLKVLEAYKKALTTWARWVDQNIDGSRTQVIFRGFSATHFRYIIVSAPQLHMYLTLHYCLLFFLYSQMSVFHIRCFSRYLLTVSHLKHRFFFWVHRKY